jgi:hypothetical protein
MSDTIRVVISGPYSTSLLDAAIAEVKRLQPGPSDFTIGNATRDEGFDFSLQTGAYSAGILSATLAVINLVLTHLRKNQRKLEAGEDLRKQLDGSPASQDYRLEASVVTLSGGSTLVTAHISSRVHLQSLEAEAVLTGDSCQLKLKAVKHGN